MPASLLSQQHLRPARECMQEHILPSRGLSEHGKPECASTVDVAQVERGGDRYTFSVNSDKSLLPAPDRATHILCPASLPFRNPCMGLIAPLPMNDHLPQYAAPSPLLSFSLLAFALNSLLLLAPLIACSALLVCYLPLLVLLYSPSPPRLLASSSLLPCITPKTRKSITLLLKKSR
eukprot:127460-Hanusia_phi.AAC.4